VPLNAGKRPARQSLATARRIWKGKREGGSPLRLTGARADFWRFLARLAVDEAPVVEEDEGVDMDFCRRRPTHA
jgi:hypothetical protein